MINKMMRLWTLTIGLFISILSMTNGQFIPLRSGQIVDKLLQYRHVDQHQFLSDAKSSATNAKEILERFLSLSSLHNSTNQCQTELKEIVEAAVQKQIWALKTIDAWGKPIPSGILKGNSFWVGNYEECVDGLYQPANKSFLTSPIPTQYCAFSTQPSSAAGGPSSSIVLGICVPVSCDRAALIPLIEEVFTNSNISAANQLSCSTDPRNGQTSLTSGAIGTITVISILAVLVILGTMIDLKNRTNINSMDFHGTNVNGHGYTTNGNDNLKISLMTKIEKKSRIRQFLIELSALRTLRHIFNISKKSEGENFKYINGIRVLALFWVIIGHSLVFGLSYSSNPLDVLSWTHNFFFQLIINAVYSVDTFFVLSGFLTAYLFIRHVQKKDRLSSKFVILYYVHRYIRLTPAFFLMVLVSINLTPYFGTGPIYPRQTGLEAPDCRSKYWWTSLTYVGNLVKPDAMCLPITWYLHNDMQFHWIAPLTLIPFVLGMKVLGYIVAIIMTLTSSVAILSILLYYPNMSLNSLTEFGVTNGPSFFDLIYITPWCRMAPYALGILTAYIVINTGREYRNSRAAKLFGHVIVFILAMLCLFGTYPDYVLAQGMSRWILVTYQTLARAVWAIVIGWIIFLCSTNQGGILNKILSWPVWTPLARLNYSCYLVHSTIISVGYMSQTLPIYFQSHLSVNNFVVHIFFSYCAALLVNIFFETPFFILEKYIFKR